MTLCEDLGRNRAHDLEQGNDPVKADLDKIAIWGRTFIVFYNRWKGEGHTVS